MMSDSSYTGSYVGHYKEGDTSVKWIDKRIESSGGDDIQLPAGHRISSDHYKTCVFDVKCMIERG